MFRLWLLLAVAFLSYEALGHRIKFQLEGEAEVQYGLDWTKLFQDPNREPPSTTNSNSNSDRIVLEDCLRSCPVTPEYNPVCGTDNVTYENPGRLQCAQSCGVNVTTKSNSRCPNNNDPPVA